VRRSIVPGTIQGILALTALLACHEIAGIEEREFDGGLCRDYCEIVMEACTEDSAVYPRIETCLGVCARLEPGNELEHTNTNDVACRLRQARLALRSPEDARTTCRSAGPGGDGICGTNCDAYCSLLKETCPNEYADIKDCATSCEGIPDQSSGSLLAEGNTLQCRLLHICNATLDAKKHCPHARAAPTAPCVDKDDTDPDCGAFCTLSEAVCRDELQVYESRAQCLAVCNALPVGKNSDTDENSVGCRIYHTYNSISSPEGHCSHTSPGGDGHCPSLTQDKIPGSCVSYCQLLAKACQTEFDEKFADQDECLADCSKIPESEEGRNYTIHVANGDTLGCRLLNVARALNGKETCPSAMGLEDCE
jgi:hypothetical protein